jgi:hypothetical protein
VNTEQLTQIAFWYVIIGGIIGFSIYLIGVARTKNKIKKILTEKVETSRKNPQVAKVYLDAVREIFGDYNDFDLDKTIRNELLVRLIRDGEVYFEYGDYETSFRRLEEAYVVTQFQNQIDGVIERKNRTEAMIKFDKAKWQLEGTDVDPLKIMVLLEEAKTLAGDYEIPGYAERKAKILDKIIEKYGK